MDDWLDARLQEDQYLPDDGFTARVMQRLPASSPLDERRRLLLFTPFLVLASALFGMEGLCAIIRSNHELRSLGGQLRHSASYVDVFSVLAYLLEQPTVLFGCLGVMAMAAYLGSPSLRRLI